MEPTFMAPESWISPTLELLKVNLQCLGDLVCAALLWELAVTYFYKAILFSIS